MDDWKIVIYLLFNKKTYFKMHELNDFHIETIKDDL